MVQDGGTLRETARHYIKGKGLMLSSHPCAEYCICVVPYSSVLARHCREVGRSFHLVQISVVIRYLSGAVPDLSIERARPKQAKQTDMELTQGTEHGCLGRPRGGFLIEI